jgi:hypothetical protein
MGTILLVVREITHIKNIILESNKECAKALFKKINKNDKDRSQIPNKSYTSQFFFEALYLDFLISVEQSGMSIKSTL